MTYPNKLDADFFYQPDGVFDVLTGECVEDPRDTIIRDWSEQLAAWRAIAKATAPRCDEILCTRLATVLEHASLRCDAHATDGARDLPHAAAVRIVAGRNP